MKRLPNLAQAEKELSEAEIRYESIKLHISHLDQQIFVLDMQEKELEQNLYFLKTTTAIAILSEFQKSKKELESVRSRRVILKIDRSNHAKYMANAEILVNEKRNTVDAIIDTPSGIIISGKFGK